MLFVGYAGMSAAEAEESRDEVLKLVPFESVFVQKASAAISVNCGPGSFGLIFARK